MLSGLENQGVHATAIVDATAQLGEGVHVGPYTVIGPAVVIGAGTRLGPHVFVERNTTIGADCRIHAGAVLGSDPQDLKFGGEETHLVVGDRTVIREYATLNRGTAALGRTQIGADCLLMVDAGGSDAHGQPGCGEVSAHHAQGIVRAHRRSTG